jgi:hypothetical protein
MAFSQGTKVLINWQSPKSIFTYGGEKQVLTFEKATYHKKNFLPQYSLQFAGKDDLKNLVISDVRYLELTETELAYLPKDFISDSLYYFNETVYSNHKPILLLNILPFRRNKISKKFEKVLSFSFVATFKPIETLKNTPNINKREEGEGAEASVLASGRWYKLEISRTGVYKLDYKFLASLGISLKNINPKNIRLYGNGGGMLPQANSAPRASDLVENSISVNGETDGKFDPEDYVLFYGKGPDEWKYNRSEEYFHNIKNVYSDYSYYFLTVSESPGKRIQEISSLPKSGNSITEFDDYNTHELDLFNLFGSGRFWYGEQFNSTSTSRQVSLPCEGIIPSSPLKIRVNAMALNEKESYFNFYVNGFKLPELSVDRQGGLVGFPEAKLVDEIFPLDASDVQNRSRLDFRIDFNGNGGVGAKGALDFISVNYKRGLKLYGRETSFRSISSTNLSEADFIIEDVPMGGAVWNVTDFAEVKNISTRRDGTIISFTTPSATLNEFVVLNGSDFPAPKFVGEVANQNIHGTAEIPNLVIVTPAEFYSQAKELASFRENNDGLKTLVVTTTQVYNEFSSGAQDVSAVRDLMKYFYDKDSGINPKLKYLLLFGACSFDYKNRISNNTNFVPVYETRHSLHDIESFSSDDYFGFLDLREGDWQEAPLADMLDIGIGRLPVASPEEAQSMVTKVLNYEKDAKAYGKWRNKVTFIADNGDGNSHASFPENTLQARVKELHPSSNITKIYIDAFPLVSTPGGSTSPAAKLELINTFKKGALIMNYSGHGGERGLAQEDILNVTDIAQLDNKDNLPFFMAATCDFGRYDDPGRIGGGVSLVKSPKGGSIAGIFSTRPVYQSSNEELNLEFFNNVYKKIDGEYPRLGDVMKGTKNSSISGISNRNYALLGDPSMRLAYPKKLIEITSINNKGFSGVDTLNALQTVRISGEVSSDGSLSQNFTGTVYITVYDKVDSLSTIGPQPMPYILQNSIIYDGEASVTNGKFDVSFIVPKDISYNIGQGKISLYAKTNLIDAAGYNNKLIIGGSAVNIQPDTDAPQMKLYINDTTFKNGGLTHDHPLLLVKLKDNSGINTSLSGIGHQITAVLDDSKDVIVLNEYYSALKDTYKEGAIDYPFTSLSIGEHKVRVKAWDTHNNSVEQTIHFVIGEKADLTIERAYAYPNPFSEKTSFTFGHNKSGENLTLELNIYNLAGTLVKTFSKQYRNSPSTIDYFDWDGSDNAGNSVQQGLYIYKLNLGSGDGTETQLIQKLMYMGK